MKYLRENPTIAFGLGLPLLLVGFFSLASFLTTISVGHPKYKVLFASQYYPGINNSVRIEVKDGKANVAAVGGNVYSVPKFFLFDPETNQIHEITYSLPIQAPVPSEQGVVNNTVTPIIIPELAALKLNSESVSPDGFTFEMADNYNAGAGFLFSEMFFSSRYRNEPSLKKGALRVRIPNYSNSYFYENHFIGWVIP